MGDLTLGALVAVIGAQKELYSPWKELLTYYQTMMDVHIKYDQVVAQFDPPRCCPKSSSCRTGTHRAGGRVACGEPRLISEDGNVILDGAALACSCLPTIAIVGPAGSGKEELTLVLANLIAPNTGRVLMGIGKFRSSPKSITGRKMTYVGYPAQVFAGTIADNLVFGLAPP